MPVARNGTASQTREIAGRLRALVGREDVSEDYVRFRIELFRAQAAIRDALAGSPPATPSDVAQTADSPALDPTTVPLDRSLLQRLLADLSASLGHQDHPGADLARLVAASAEAPELIKELVRKASFGPDRQYLATAGRRLGIDPEALLFFGRILSAPFVTATVERLEQRVTAGESSGSCPWCGSPPGLAMLLQEEGKEGRRTLGCSLCGERWEFARTECPYCGDRHNLGTLSWDENDPRTIETCDRCGGYLKTVDLRKLSAGEPVVALVETTATLYLDLIAEAEGYVRGLPYAALR